MAEEGKRGSGVRVCVTGGAGFIGSWLVKKLLERGYTVHATLRDTGARRARAPLLRLMALCFAPIRRVASGNPPKSSRSEGWSPIGSRAQLPGPEICVRFVRWPQGTRRRPGCCAGWSPPRRSGCGCSRPTSSTPPPSRRPSLAAGSSSSSPRRTGSKPPAPR